MNIFHFKIGNNVTQDDIWHPIGAKFQKVLNLWKSRHLSLLEKYIGVNVLALSKIWYIGSVLHVSKQYICKYFNIYVLPLYGILNRSHWPVRLCIYLNIAKIL
jgi:hypothetical protein